MREPSIEEVAKIVQSMTRVAVLGAHEKPDRPAHYVPQALADGGVAILPVNARFAGKTLFDETVVSTLAELDVPVDVVDVFRRSDVLHTHLDDTSWRCRRVQKWFGCNKGS